MDRPVAPELTSDLDHWEVTFKGGQVARVRAHSLQERPEAFVFCALMKGSPNYEYELARFPREVVENVEGGWLNPRA